MFRKIISKFPLTPDSFSQRGCQSKKNFWPSNLQGRLGVLGVPFGKGQKQKGKEEVGLRIAPDLLRKMGFMDELIDIGVEVSDYGNIEYEPEHNLVLENMHNLSHFSPCARKVSDAVECILEDERCCLILGGDHSVAVGSIHGHMQVAGSSKVALLYVDAHADANTSSTSPTGNVHGMTMALLCREMRDEWDEVGLPGMRWMSNWISLKNVAYIATRSVDQGEMRFLKENNVAVFGIEDIDKHGMHKVIRYALDRIDPGCNKSIHVSFDMGALDPSEAPCTTCPVRGGLTLREAIYMAECVHRTKRLTVVDLVEVNGAIGNDIQRQITLQAANHIVMAFFGYSRKGNEYKERDSSSEETVSCGS